ncbi:uncharacterized protein LOC128875697 [Hylaeus volcanicus]|uniref:uncharacterized protein LOC128875697 n=1 Tax=Hylaeus volcanicus TaxID=313075 RepID=UPI0023B7F705|nr:uncharacterized protein LOC128875697 [Hylaeus volcanicus]
MSVLEILLFAIQVTIISGRLTVLRGKSAYTFGQNMRKLACVSEDDGSGLIWNSNLNWIYEPYKFSDRSTTADFRSLNGYQREQIDCDLNSNEGCMRDWSTAGWSLANSGDKPMGPVMDRRWEGFVEYNNFDSVNEYRLLGKLGKVRMFEGALAISVRGSRDAHILFCKSKRYETDFCYWIIIGGWTNTESVIRKCANGVPNPWGTSNDDMCTKLRASYKRKVLSPTEWKTFVITWNETTKELSVYDNENLLLTYVDREERSLNTPANYTMFIRSPVTMLFRFHIYDFLHTTDSKAALTSPPMSLFTKNLCIELIIGLCTECEMEIVLLNPSNENIEDSLKVIGGSKMAAAHGLAMWQYVRINKTISTDFGQRVKIKLIPKLQRESSNPLWVVANFRVCPSADSVRQAIMTATQDYNRDYYWPVVTCQKLFYDEIIVVNSVPDAILNLEFDDLYCPEGKEGLHCSISCYSDLESRTDCGGTAICERTGCTCPPGFIGENCDYKCAINRYGHDCKGTCGQCKEDICNVKSGTCTYGCDNSKRYYIPPFCKRVIDPLPPPNIDFINETTVRAVLPAREEYTLVSSSYRFVIRKNMDDSDTDVRRIRDNVKIFKNMTTLIGYTDDLEPGTTYKIFCDLHITDDSNIIHGQLATFTTRCTPYTNFEVVRGNISLTLKKGRQVDPLYTCPDHWYGLVFENCETNVQIKNGTVDKLPHQFMDLTPYTRYKITVYKGAAILFSQEVRTLDAAPSSVRNIKTTLLSNKKVTIKWDLPQHLNGIIKNYTIVLKVLMYFGCSDLNRDSPKKEITTTSTSTDITFPDLNPYAKYVAAISACTSYCGPVQKTVFDTDQSEIPTAVYSDLTTEAYMLTWKPPENCTTISGPLCTRIIITGISKSVVGVNITKQTKQFNIDLKNILNGTETYEARIYVIRDYGKRHNDLLYQKIIFTMPPKAPPPVRNLEIYETDLRAKIAYLRWQKPEAPIHGEIKHYIVSNCYLKQCNTLLKVQPTTHCNLWDDYVCAAVKEIDYVQGLIEVSAVNANLSTPGNASRVPIFLVEFKPEAPHLFTVETLDKGVVNVSWSHPWRTGGRLEKFLIISKIISSDLRMEIQESKRTMIHEHLVKEYQSRYSQQLHFLSSTTYVVSIRGVTIMGKSGVNDFAEVRTPLATGFETELTSEVRDKDSTITLRIPTVVNDTRNSLMNVIVKGPQPCERYVKLSPLLREKTGIDHYETAWRAATFSTEKFAGKTFTVGDNKLYGDATNCPLKPDESYVIMVIVQTEESIDDQIIVVKTTSIRVGEVPRRHDEAWIIPIMILLVVAVVAFYFYRRKKRGPSKVFIHHEEMSLARKTENLEDKSILTNSSHPPKSVTPTPSNKECLSRTSTPDDDRSILVNDVNQNEEVTSMVKVKDFEDYVKQAIDSGLLDTQYNTLPRGQTKSWEYGKLPQNKPKNRYGNLIAYDENRVILNKLSDDPHSDYINANYIKGYKKEKCYIATQGPKATTVIDFWRMIWQEETLIICMVANTVENGKAKCEQYWPDILKKKKYGDLLVFNAKHTVFADYTFRTFHVTCGNDTRKIEHLHYTAWPDHGVPLSTHSVVTYLKKLLATSPGNGPVVVHCSAGVGRTGTIILCDICLRRAAAEGVVDVYAETMSIRSQRANMVDTKQQYLLAHLTLLECLLSIPTSLPCDEILPLKIMELKKQLVIQQHSLKKTSWQDEALRPPTSQSSLSERNLAKNRFPELASAKVGRVYLKRYPPTDEDSDYISAIYVDGVRLQNQYLATQLPLPGTFSDFWRMVAEYKVELIVMLQPPDPNDTSCCPIIPSEEFKPVPYINIKATGSVEFDFYVSHKLVLIDNSEKPAMEQQVTILRFTEWTAGRNQNPPSTMTLVTLWQATERISRGDGPTVVLCHDGVTGCGLYLALSFLLERMAVERECDVCLAIRAVRRSRPDFVQSLEHMEYLYDAVITYLKYFETYANFT